VKTGKDRSRHEGDINRLECQAFSPDGRTLAVGSSCLFAEPAFKVPREDFAHIRLLDVATGKERLRWTAHKSSVHNVAYSPDGKVLASAGSDGIRLWDPATGAERRRLTLKYPLLRSFAFTADSKTLTAHMDGALRRWDVGTGKELPPAGKLPEGFYVAAVSFDGKLLALTKPEEWDTIYLCEAATGKERGRFMGNQGGTPFVAFSPDGKRLATGGPDTTVLVWDVAGAIEKGQGKKRK
jgi:WD40 repeat protein